jgi:two-component system OmpR family sensor kinase/two-component system sensor histidine kinase BaeS
LPPFRSLFWRLFGAFLLLAVVILGTVTLLVSRASSTEVRGYVGRRGTMGEAELAAQLEAYFQGRGSWEGVDSLLGPPGRMGEPMMGHGMMGRGVVGEYLLADAQGRILAGAGGRSGVLSDAERAGAVALVVGDQGIGFLFHTPPPGLSPEEELLGRLNRAVWISSGVAALAALLVAGVLSGRLLRPVRALTRAAHGMAQGDLGQRVDARGEGELADLSRTFNRMAESLERAETLRRDMTADVAHELRNPLAVIQARLEGISDGVYPASRDELASVLEQSRVLNRLVEDLRMLALADSGQLMLERHRVDLISLARDVVASFQPHAASKDVELSFSTDDGDRLEVEADPTRLMQILDNLLTNALRHTPAGGRVALGVRGDAGRAVVDVADSGEGFPPEALPFVFERFYRADKSRARHAGGSGLGLAIARKLVEAHGGTVSASNRPEGGALVRVELPLTPPSATTPG